jgi:hypothetical protein
LLFVVFERAGICSTSQVAIWNQQRYNNVFWTSSSSSLSQISFSSWSCSKLCLTSFWQWMDGWTCSSTNYVWIGQMTLWVYYSTFQQKFCCLQMLGLDINCGGLEICCCFQSMKLCNI